MTDGLNKKHIETMEALNKASNDSLSDMIKHIITISSALLAITVSLNQPPHHNICVFYILIALLLLSILAGVALMYVVLRNWRRMCKDFSEELLAQLDDPTRKPQAVFSQYDTLLRVCEVICLVSFLASIVFLVIYSIG